MRRLGPLYGGAVALIASTPWRWPGALVDDRRAPAWLVALGVPVGVGAWSVTALARGAGLPTAVAAVLGVVALTALSAALLERGVAAQVAAWAEAGADTSTSAIPTVVLTFTILLRVAAVLAVAPTRWLAVFVATATVGRWAAIFLQALGDPIADDAPRSLVVVPPPLWLAGALSVGVGALAIYALGTAGVAVLALTAVIAFGLGLAGQRDHRALGAATVAMAAAVGELLVLVVATLRG
jgi:hypothetical protein